MSVHGSSVASSTNLSPTGACSATQPRPLDSLRKMQPLLTVTRVCASNTVPLLTYCSAWLSARRRVESVERSSRFAGSSA